MVAQSARVRDEERPQPTPVGAPAVGLLAAPAPSPQGQALLDDDVAELGYVMNASRLWGHMPEAQTALFALLADTVRQAGLSYRQRGVLVSACASTLGDAYCSLAWGARLAGAAGPDVAAGVLRGDDSGLAADEAALAEWARTVVRDPNGTQAADLAPLRAAGFDDGQIFAITLFVALRAAFSAVNDALGAAPDGELVDRAPAPVRDAVTFGRRPERRVTGDERGGRP